MARWKIPEFLHGLCWEGLLKGHLVQTFCKRHQHLQVKISGIHLLILGAWDHHTTTFCHGWALGLTACSFCAGFCTSQCQWYRVVHSVCSHSVCSHSLLAYTGYTLGVWGKDMIKLHFFFFFFLEQQESNLRLNILNCSRTGNYLRH